MAARWPALLLAVACSFTGCTGERAGAAAAGARPPDEPLAWAPVPRMVAPRLSVLVEYRPCAARAAREGTISAGDCDIPAAERVPSRRTLDLAARAAARIRAGIDPRALHAAALVDLLWGGAGNALDRSISYLHTASRLAEQPAPVLADLAAAYLVRAARRQNPRDLLEAIEAAAMALESDSSNVAARFDLALALDALGLDAQADDAWHAYLAADGRSRWADEARARLRARAAPHRGVELADDATLAEATALAERDPQGAREQGWDRELGAWGEAELAGDTARARARLARAAAMGEALERRGGDATLRDAVRAIGACAGDPPATRALARAHREYADAQRHYRAADYDAAGRALARVTELAPLASPLRAWASLSLGATLVYRRRPAEGERLMRAVAARADTIRHPSLAARARWTLGLTLLRRGRHDEGMTQIRAAERLFERAGERENAGAMQYLQAEASFSAGDDGAGYAAMHRALMTLRPFRDAVWLHNLLYVSAAAATTDRLPRAAARLQDEGIAVAARTGRSLDLAEARLARARVRSAAGDDAGSRDDLRAARETIERLPPGVPRRFLGADLQLSTAVAAMRADPARTVGALDSTIAFFGSPPNPVRLGPALLARAEAMLALGREADAAADLERSIELLDERASDIRSAAQRALLLDRARAVFDRVVMMRLANGGADAGLAYLERGRASLSPGNARAASGYRRGGYPPARRDRAIVDYALVGDTLLAWTVAGSGIELTRATVNRDRLLRTIERARAALELRAADVAVRPDLALLHEWLVAPIAARLGGDGRPVTIIADGELAGVPFAALYDRERGRYLIEDHTLRFAGSLRDAARPARRARADGDALLVADPAFDPREFPGLARLAGAEAEASAIAALYAERRVLAGADADRASIAAALPRAAVVHFAGHAVFDDERPERSYLVTAARERSATGRLTAEEIARLELGRARLVVLSACRTAPGREGRSGGFAGLAGAFLAAGASGVVGSLWRVDDALTRRVMEELHRAYAARGDGAEALRAAQLAMLRSADPALRTPAVWAGFRYAGE